MIKCFHVTLYIDILYKVFDYFVNIFSLFVLIAANLFFSIRPLHHGKDKNHHSCYIF